MKYNHHLKLASTIMSLTLAGCGGGSDTGSFTLGITDAPVDNAAKISIKFTGIGLQKISGEWLDYEFDTPKTIDLLKLHGGGSETLIDRKIPVGCYKELKLKLSNDSQAHHFEPKTGGIRLMHLSSEHEHGLQVHHEFCSTTKDAKDFIMHFDLRKSVYCPTDGGDCTLKPVLNLVDNANMCHISGVVDHSHVSASLSSCTGGDEVYVFKGHDVVPCDTCEGSACTEAGACNASPVATATVTLDPNSGDYIYTAAFLEAGDYTMAFTCHAKDDQPGSHEIIPFTGSANESCSTGENKTHHFHP